MNRKIIGIGETILDIVFKDDRPVTAIPGGSTFNSMISIGRTAGRDFPGVAVGMFTETGNDHVGDIISSFMKANGVGTGYVTRNLVSQSPISLAFLGSGNDAHYQFYREHNAAKARLEKPSGISFTGDDIVLFGSYFAVNPEIRDYTASILRNAYESGAILLYDINFRKNHIGELPRVMDNIRENCRLSTVVRGSIEDFQTLYGIQDPEKVYADHIRSLCPVLICTCGADPVHIFTPELHLRIPVPEVKTVSTIGAGDNFNAGVLYAILGMGLKKDDIRTLPAEKWKDITRTAVSFSSEVCGLMDNYVGKDFAPDFSSQQ